MAHATCFLRHACDCTSAWRLLRVVHATRCNLVAGLFFEFLPGSSTRFLGRAMCYRPALRTILIALSVVIQKGRIIGERYGEGVTMHTPLESWSMGKSLTATLMGVLIQ